MDVVSDQAQLDRLATLTAHNNVAQLDPDCCCSPSFAASLLFLPVHRHVSTLR